MTELLVTVAAAARQRVLRRQRVRADRLPAHRRRAAGRRARSAARWALSAMNQIPLMIAGAQLGITICSLGLGAIAEPALAHLLEAPFARGSACRSAAVHPIAFVLALGVVVFLHTVVGEMVPKNITLAGPERSVLWLGPPMLAFCMATKPLLLAMKWASRQVLRALADRGGRRGEDRLHRRGAGRPGHPGAHRGPARRRSEHARITGALALHSRTAGDALRPWSDGHHGGRGRLAGLAGGAGDPHRPVPVPGGAAGDPAGARLRARQGRARVRRAQRRRCPIPADV